MMQEKVLKTQVNPRTEKQLMHRNLIWSHIKTIRLMPRGSGQESRQWSLYLMRGNLLIRQIRILMIWSSISLTSLMKSQNLRIRLAIWRMKKRLTAQIMVLIWIRRNKKTLSCLKNIRITVMVRLRTHFQRKNLIV